LDFGGFLLFLVDFSAVGVLLVPVVACGAANASAAKLARLRTAIPILFMVLSFAGVDRALCHFDHGVDRTSCAIAPLGDCRRPPEGIHDEENYTIPYPGPASFELRHGTVME
jgi:hypothetical protein